MHKGWDRDEADDYESDDWGFGEYYSDDDMFGGDSDYSYWGYGSYLSSFFIQNTSNVSFHSRSQFRIRLTPWGTGMHTTCQLLNCHDSHQ